MRTLIKNTTVVTSNTARTIHHDAAIVIDGDVIAAIGTTRDLLRQFPDVEVVEGRGRSVFPGLVNCHTHLCLTALRGIQEDFGFPTTLRFPVPVRALMSAEENAVFAMLGAVEALRSGNTTLLVATAVSALALSLLRKGDMARTTWEEDKCAIRPTRLSRQF